jgi:capsular polysaccharide transport system ATP-binding protein
MIILEDVYKRYHTPQGRRKWVLKGISFTIPKNCNVALIGANGAGKSTLLRLIGGMDEPTRGSVASRLVVGTERRNDRPSKRQVFVSAVREG